MSDSQVVNDPRCYAKTEDATIGLGRTCGASESCLYAKPRPFPIARPWIGLFLCSDACYSIAVILEILPSLFERWWQLEVAAGKTTGQILKEINAACGTAYKHNWPSLMASRGFSLERLSTAVRRYMMRRVLPAELAALGIHLSPEALERLVKVLT